MSNEMITKNKELLETITNTELNDLIKPLVKEIHLFDTYVAGTTYVADQNVFNEINIGDRLTLVREENKFDDNAILIQTKEGFKLGYIPEKDNLIFSRLMDAGKLLIAKISTHEPRGKFHKIGIGIYLTDY
jgi:hypothetical protein